MKTISLCGTWRIKGATSDRGGLREWPNPQPLMPTYPAEVPGTVQEALEFMTGDVHLGHNVYNARFIEEQYWLYTRHVTLTEEDLSLGRVRLVFEGLDLTALVYVNGKQVALHNNFYVPLRVDVTELVTVGDNRIDVRLDSGLYDTAFKDVNMVQGHPTSKLLRRVWSRKPQSAYEWDWSPRLLNVGIFKPCYLEIAPAHLNETAVYHTLSPDDSLATLTIRQYMGLHTERAVRLDGVIAETGECASWEGDVGVDGYAPLTLTVQNPKLWYPRNHGEPFRYTLRLTVSDVESGQVIGVVEKRVGLRRVEIDQSERAAGGRYFKLMINGTQLFAKGGNIIPIDILFSRLTRDRYEVLIDRALENNFNMLRVWGGGVYETDDFYELCDEKGIVVWQDFVGACATYPAFDGAFVNNYLSEIRYNIRRMSSYASLVVYAGNNEIDESMSQNTGGLLRMYTDASLYYVVLPRILREEGDHHYYQPSSPWSPDGDHPASYHSGDQHPWAIGFADRDYFKYRRMDCRFPNEGGILGPTSLPCMMAALGEGQRFIHSMDFKIHDNSIADRDKCAPERMLAEKLGFDVEKDFLSMPIADYVYYGGFLQGEGLCEYILNFRRRMNDTTSAAVFWMFNDCWPATRSWTTIDYLRNRTPAFWAVKRSFAPVTVDIVKTEGGFDVYGVNEWLKAKSGKLTYGYFLPSGEVNAQEIAITLVANNSCVLAAIDGATLPEGAIPFAELDVTGEPLARRRWVDKAYNELGLEKTDIKITKNADGTATYTADKPVLGVCLDLDGDDGNLSDNFFDLYPARPYTVKTGSKSGDVLYSYMG